MIGSDMEIQVIAIKGKQIQLGIKAPKETKILREELFEKMKQSPQSNQAS